MSWLYVDLDCGRCRKPFRCNPAIVPTVEGVPVCRRCLQRLNRWRQLRQAEPVAEPAGAYEPPPGAEPYRG